MTVGRKPKPAEQKRREGDRSHRPPVQPSIIGGRVDEGEKIPPPPDLSTHMTAVWTVVVEDLRSGGVLDRADLASVEAFAVAMGRVREIRAYLRTLQTKAEPFGHLLADSARGTQAHPLLSQERGFLTEARQIGENLGLSAMARTRLGLDAKGSLKPQGMESELERKIGKSPRLRVHAGGRA